MYINTTWRQKNRKSCQASGMRRVEVDWSRHVDNLPAEITAIISTRLIVAHKKKKTYKTMLLAVELYKLGL